jgi:hypothetical protein
MFALVSASSWHLMGALSAVGHGYTFQRRQRYKFLESVPNRSKDGSTSEVIPINVKIFYI